MIKPGDYVVCQIGARGYLVEGAIYQVEEIEDNMVRLREAYGIWLSDRFDVVDRKDGPW
jgi:hypothetical protein